MKHVPQSEAIEANFAKSEAALPDRLPWPLAALVIGSLSVGLWVLIYAALRAFA